MHIIDTHAHMYDETLMEEIEIIMARAVNAGVEKILLPAIDSASHTAMLALCQQYPDICLAMMGLHPCYVKNNYLQELALVEEYLNTHTCIAIGEIGLDYYWSKEFINEQHIAFEQQLSWAAQKKLPVSIHSRSANEEAIHSVNKMQNGNLKGIFHCFSGSIEQAKKMIDLGFYLGVGGVVTFKNGGLDAVIKEIGLAQLVLETDAPYLAPAPFRGKRNESSYLHYVVEKIAEIVQISETDVANITTANAKKMFSL